MHFSLLDQSSALLYPSARSRRWRHTCHPARLIRPAPSCPKRRRRKGASWVPLSARAIGRRGGSSRRERPRRRRLCRVAVRVRGFARMLQLLLAEPRLRTVRPTDAHALPPRLVPLRPTHGSLQEIRRTKPYDAVWTHDDIATSGSIYRRVNVQPLANKSRPNSHATGTRRSSWAGPAWLQYKGRERDAWRRRQRGMLGPEPVRPWSASP